MRSLPALAADVATPPLAPAVLRNAAFLLLAYLLPRTLTFAAVVVAARLLEGAAFGAYSTAAAFAVMISIVATLGMMPLLIREIARAPEEASSLLRSAHLFKSVMNVCMLGGLLVLGKYVLEYPAAVMTAALLLAIGYAIGAYVENLAAYFQAIERMEIWMQASVLTGIVWGGAGTLLIVATSSLVWFCLAPALGQLAGLTWLLVRAPAEIRRGTGVDIGAIRRLLRHLLPFAAAALALTIYYKIDVLLLALWRSDFEVGIYSAAYKLVDIWQALMVVGVSAAYPRLARLARASDVGERWAATRMSELVLLVAIPLAGILWFARVPTILVLYGVSYQDAIPVLGLLALLLPALAINILSGYVLASTGHMARAACLYGSGVVLNVGLNAALTPTGGAPGAARAMLASEILLAGGFLVSLRAHSAVPNARTAGIAAGALGLWGIGAVIQTSVPTILVATLYLVGVLVLYRRTNAISPGEWQTISSGLRPWRFPVFPADPPRT